MNPGMRDACWCVPTGWRVVLAAVFALAALPLSGARADVTAQVPTVVARVLPPEFVATATAASTPSDGLISSSLAVSPITGLLVGDQGFVTLSPRSPGVFAGARTDIWWRPATYYWQAYDRHCSLPSPPACHSAPVAFQVTPLPAPAMVAPADGAQHVNGTPLTITVQDVPAYDGARQLSVEYSRSPELAPSGLFAQPFLGAFPAPSWVLASRVPATGTATQTLATGNTAALAHARIYWHALRKDCWAEPDCMVTEGVRSFTITPGPVPGYPGLDPETRVLFAIPPQIPIGYLLVKRAHPHKVKIGDVTAAMNCRALPCHVSTRVTIRLGGRTLLRAGRTFARPADPAKWWSDANHIERVKVSKRLRAQIMTALKRNRRVSVTAIATATDLAGRPERHVSRGTFFLSPARTK
jgi:hypothetical protein